jgi:predicted transcriptional regulator
MNDRVYPSAIKRKATKLLGQGHSAIHIAKELNVTAASVRRWAKEAGVSKGKLAEAPLLHEFTLPMEQDERLPVVKALKEAERREEYRDQLATASSAAEQYRAMVVANGVKMLDAAFKSPPVVKNMRDLKTLTEVVNDALGLSGKKNGGSGRLAIDLNVLTAKNVTVEAEIIEENP